MADRSKTGKKARNKGAKFERDVCKIFTNWWGKTFRRTPLSGGWQKDMLTGDVSLVADDRERKRFPFSVECGNCEDWSFDGMMRNNNSYLMKKWEQCCNDAYHVSKVPLLVFSKAYHDIWCMFVFDMMTETVQKRIKSSLGYRIITPAKKIIMKLSDFLILIDKEYYTEVNYAGRQGKDEKDGADTKQP